MSSSSSPLPGSSGLAVGPGDPLAQAAVWRDEGHACAIATVVKTWGSSPRPVGSKLAVRADGAMAGSVSGGCVEGAVVTAAVDVMRSHRPTKLEFGVADEDAWAVGLACGGRIDIFIEEVD